MKKSHLLRMLCAACLLTLLVACGGGGGGGGGSGGNAANATNIPPVANAGFAQIAQEMEVVLLDAGMSSDIDRDIVSYKWTAPAGVGITLGNDDRMIASFVAPAVDEPVKYKFELHVTDSAGAESTDTTWVTVTRSDLPAPLGFLPFGASDDHVLVSAPLTSPSDIGGGVLVGDDPAAAVFDPDLGVQLNRKSAIQFTDLMNGAVEQADLVHGGHITLWITKYYLRGAKPAVNEYSLYSPSGGVLALYHMAASHAVAIETPMGTGPQLAEFRLEGKSDKTRIDISWTADEVSVYVDFLLAITAPTDGGNTFSDIYIGGLGTAGIPSPNAWISDVQIVARPIVLPVHYATQHVNIYGDSFTQLGQYPPDNLAILARTEDGLLIDTKANQSMDDVGMLSTIHRELARNDVYIGSNRVYFWGQGGLKVNNPGGVKTLASRIDASLNLLYPVPDVAFIAIGTNDVSGGKAQDADAWKALYLAQVDKLIASGCDNIVIGNVTPMRMEATYDTPGYIASLDRVNSLINSLASERNEVTVVDLFNLFGGHYGFNPDDWGAGGTNRHPSKQGSQKLGKWLAEGLLERLK